MSVYTHSLSPFFIEVSQGIGLRWYGLSYIAAFIFATFIIKWKIKNSESLLKIKDVSDFVYFAAFGILIGGRLGYCLFYAPHLFLQWSPSFPFWGILELHKGGMASHGGLLGVIAACYFYAKKKQLNFLHLVDLASLSAGVGLFFGRLANFINGELYGRACVEACYFGVRFPQELYRWLQEMPSKLNLLAPLVEKMSNDNIGIPGQKITAEIWNSLVAELTSQSASISSSAQYKISLWINKIITLSESSNPLVIQHLSILTVRYPSQIFQALLEGLLVFILCFFIWKKPRPVGFITGCFGLFYSIARIIGEAYRMPDLGVGFQWLGLTRGQWLSIAFIAISLTFLLFSIRTKQKTL
ncbi:MAG: prolipoprotein diacylglyceryl transferase [Bdellovibrionales bacterium]|nr:prolipoprotein diacylglyceryl transferase [Bdellovibrionales bacterium]